MTPSACARLEGGSATLRGVKGQTNNVARGGRARRARSLTPPSGLEGGQATPD